MPAVRNIILTGFMGSGKSRQARELARRLGWTLLDTDAVIEQRAGKPISRIFAEDGEPAFRALESEVARSLAGLERHVIATGGGLILNEANLRALEAAGAVVLLEAQPETVWQRVRHSTHRPLLARPDARAEIDRLLAARRPAYRKVTLRVATDDREPAAVSDEILSRLATRPAGRVQVDVEVGGGRDYPIQIGAGWLGELGRALAPVFSPRRCALVTNPEIGRAWGGAVTEALTTAGYTIERCEIPEGETHKTMATLGRILDHLVAGKFSRQAGVIALGGGVVGDITGFAAACFLRGIAYIQLPTSLLAMVDSSVGGKTGVNHPLGKNLIGAFWQPLFVGIELDFLRTLSDVELRAGMAEVIKYGVIADPDLFAYLDRHIEAALARDPEVLGWIVRRSCQLKAEVVGADERESGLRAILNFGHTFGHAAEALSHYGTIRHGEGVAMGMAAAARLAVARGMLDDADAARLEALLTRAGLPTRMLRYGLEDYWTAMGSDKKVRDGRIRFVLPTRLGEVSLVDDVTRPEVEAVLEATMA